MKLIIAAITALYVAGTIWAASAQVETEASSYGDGVASAGNCTVSEPRIFVVGTNDLMGSAHLTCGKAGDTRIVKLKMGEALGDGTYRIFEVQEFTPNAGATPDKEVFFDQPNTSCGDGSGTYALLISVKRQGGTVDRDQSQDALLPVSGCL
jgi:hypothetical protein